MPRAQPLQVIAVVFVQHVVRVLATSSQNTAVLSLSEYAFYFCLIADFCISTVTNKLSTGTVNLVVPLQYAVLHVTRETLC